jgi:phosphate transport system substrate-binding protein
MNPSTIVPCIGLVAAMLLSAGEVATANTLRMGGIGAATMLLPDLFEAFEGSGAVKLKVIPSLGSSGGLRALTDGVLDVAVSGRLLTEQERAAGLRTVLSIRTPFVLVTSHPQPNGLRSSEIADIFKSLRPTWEDGSSIRLILRPRSDSDTAALGGMFPGMAAAIEIARQRPDIPLAATDQDNADLAERMAGSLSASTLTQIISERRALRVVKIDGIDPSLAAFESGSYPYAKTLDFTMSSRPSPHAETFIAFLRSSAGQAVLRSKGSILIPK